MDSLPMLQAVAKANAAIMERTPFAIDDAQDSDEEEDEDEDDEEDEDEDEDEEEDDEEEEEEEVEEDDQVLDEVDAFLEAHDSGLTEADQEAAKREWFLFNETSMFLMTKVTHSLFSELLTAEPLR